MNEGMSQNLNLVAPEKGPILNKIRGWMAGFIHSREGRMGKQDSFIRGKEGWMDSFIAGKEWGSKMVRLFAHDVRSKVMS